MLKDLRLDLRKNSVENYADDLIIELDKLKVSLGSSKDINSSAKQEIVKEIIDYIRITKIYSNSKNISK